MLMPKKVKFRKQQRGRMAGKAWRGSDVSFGDYGLRALEPCWLTDRQIGAGRVAMTRFIARGGKIWVRVFPDKPITKKPQETRMGKGKGAPEQRVCVVRPGRVLFEMEGISEKDAREAMKLAAAKLPILTRFATRFAQEKMLWRPRNCAISATTSSASRNAISPISCSACVSRSRWGSSRTPTSCAPYDGTWPG